MTISAAKNWLAGQLSGQYDPGEANAIARIAIEDGFPQKSELNEAEYHTLEQFAARLKQGEPIQHIVGMAYFFGLKFNVSPAVLIPRQETEELVAWAIQLLKKVENSVVLDVGLGSGCIGLTLKHKTPGLQLWGLEISPSAFEIACENALKLGYQPVNHPPSTPDEVRFLEMDVTNRNFWNNLPEFDAVISNPPYVLHNEAEWISPQVKRFEPAVALFAPGNDPIYFYRVIADLAKEKLRTGGYLFFECNPFTAEKTVEMLKDKNFNNIELRRDIPGQLRMICAVWKG